MIVNCDQEGIEKALESIKRGGIVVFPTDTVYGIGCDPFNSQSVKKIFEIKGRPRSKPLPVLGASMKEISKIAVFDKISKKIAEKFWPGPLTLILKVKDEKITKSLCLEDKIAVRVPDSPCITDLLKGCKLIVGTSANISGQKPFYDSKEITGKLEGYDIMLDGGKIPNPTESTIVEVVQTQVRIIRSGKITEEEVFKLI